MRLSDCFIEMIGYTAAVLSADAERQPNYTQVRGHLQRLISQSETALKEGRVPHEDYDLARFAVFAWVDETVLASRWEGRQQWQREQLQRQYYHTADAGEIFFEKLNGIGPHQRDVREVFFLCLALGFSGQYIHAGDELLLEQLRASNLKLLSGSSLGLPSPDKEDLFPEAYPSAAEPALKISRRRRWPLFTAACTLAPPLLGSLLYAVYWFILRNIGDHLIHTVPW